MPDKEKPLLSIGDDGIKINLKKGDSIKTNANEIFMRGVEQNVVGGTLEHRVTENLTQIGNKMEATDGGQILNEVEGGTLNQWGNQMKASRDGIIVNRVSKKIRVVTWIIIVSFFADMASLYFFGIHLWSKVF